MSWLYSQVLVETYSPRNYSDGKPPVPLSVMPTQHPFLHNAKTTAFLNHSQYGLTCQVLTEQDGEAVLMSYLEGFPVKTSPVQERVQGFKEKGPDSGITCKESSEKSSLRGSLLRTPLCSEPEDCDTLSEDLPISGSCGNGVVSVQPSLEPTTTGKGCGSLLPTPSGCRSGKNHIAGRLDEWGGSSNCFRGTPNGKVHCPRFEEWMMGWPDQWTALTPLGMGKFQSWLQQHSVYSLEDY